MKRKMLAVVSVMAALCLSACGSPSGVLTAVKDIPTKPAEINKLYAVPEFRDAVFSEDMAEDYGVIRFDGSNLAEGYIALQAESGARLKLQVIKSDETYLYDLHNDGSTEIIPLNMGSGEYTFRLMENVVEKKYACTWSECVGVELRDEFQCFLRPSQIADYSRDSACVSKAKELAVDCATDVEVVSAVYDYLVENIKYDIEKARTVEPGYLPVPDETLLSGKGICFDYASLACAMMRSVGIPCKLIMGYVNGDLYHAWNSFYLENTGWVTVGIEAPSNDWQRVDITFAAGGAGTDTLTDDGNYTTRFTY